MNPTKPEDYNVTLVLEYKPFEPPGHKWHATLWFDSEDFELGEFWLRITARIAAHRYARKKFREWYGEDKYVTLQKGREGG